jgi:hypothetical protein
MENFCVIKENVVVTLKDGFATCYVVFLSYTTCKQHEHLRLSYLCLQKTKNTYMYLSCKVSGILFL